MVGGTIVISASLVHTSKPVLSGRILESIIRDFPLMDVLIVSDMHVDKYITVAGDHGIDVGGLIRSVCSKISEL